MRSGGRNFSSRLSLFFGNSKIKMRFMTLLFCFLILTIGITTYFYTYSDMVIDFKDDPDYLESGIYGNKVCVNDLESDYYYYMGLNYTYSDNDILPTTYNKNIYNDSNLVQVKITYLGDDGYNRGYVSLEEMVDTYIYYKTIAIEDGYVYISLIDNPFTNRPNGMGFNGWFTNYNGAVLYYDNDYYERSVRVPVTYTDGKPDKIDITFRAKWNYANIQMVDNSFNDAIGDLYENGMRRVDVVTYDYADVNMRGYFHQVKLSWGDSYAGYYNSNGVYQNSGTCRSWGGCTYYSKIENENFDVNGSYYELSSSGMVLIDNNSIERPISGINVDKNFDGANMATYYSRVLIPLYGSISGYYDYNGNYVSSGTCNDTNGCTYYKLLNFYDDSGMEEVFDYNKEYYYLVTRDINILVLNRNISGSWSNRNVRKFTLTGINNGTSYNATWHANAAVNCYEDIGIENLIVYYGSRPSNYNPPTGSSTMGVLFGRYNNVKIGRGIKRNGSYSNFRSIVAGSGNDTGSNNSPTKYKVIIESGNYNSISLSTGNTSLSSNTVYVNNKTIYGNDYDRASGNNSNLDIYYCASGSWSGDIYSSTNSATSNIISFDLTVKSGTFGSGKNDYTTGIYVGGRRSGYHYAPTKVRVEGGYIYNLIGGPLPSEERSNLNSSYIYMTGGEVDGIFGGAGESATYGNRIISVTGGVVNYSLFGGSNGYQGSDGDGTLNGTPYIYVGGNAIIGKDEYVNNNSLLYGAEAGSIFGIGNGRNGYSTIGSADNSIIVLDGEATVNRNIYGGGNYGATGISGNNSSSYSKIIINDGFIEGSVYGGGNNNGMGSSSLDSTIDIEMYGGNVVGSVYGGSNALGIVYGSVNLGIYGGEITNSVYGGGRGGFTSNTNSGTFVRDNVNVVIGDNDSKYTPIINGSIYGGSAYGTVNGISISNTKSSSSTKVTINKGIINNVFGGGQGDDNFTPYVNGDVLVTVNGGVISSVYGGNDKSGNVLGKLEVVINDGDITNTFGGGNETDALETNVYLNGGSSDLIFGGSNLNGVVDVSNVTTTGGKSNVVYGGNNAGGSTGTTNVTINGGDIDTVYGGGDRTSVTNKTIVNLNSSCNSLFGGSNKSGDVPNSYVTINDGSATLVYGGNNAGGLTNRTEVSLYGGNVDTIYGGGLKAFTTVTNVNLYYGNVISVYGGGNEAGATTTNIDTGNVTAGNIFGGSNKSGDVNDSYILSTLASDNNSLAIDTSFSESTINSIGATDIVSSETIDVNIVNNSSVELVKWDLYIMTSDGIFDSNWSSVKVDMQNGYFHANEVNNWYGTNTISGGSSLKFSFNIHSYVSFDEFKIYGYSIVGYDSNGNKYTGYSSKGSSIKNVYGGNNAGGTTVNSNVNLTCGNIDTVYGGGENAPTNNSNIDVSSIFVTNIYGGGDNGSTDIVTMNVTDSTIYGNIYGGGNEASVNNDITLGVDNTSVNGNIYSGGNLGAVKGKVTTVIDNSTVIDSIFGGGKSASVGNSDNEVVSSLDVIGTTCDTVYGGGEDASVNGNTDVHVSNSKISSIYGGGSGENSFSTSINNDDNPAKVMGNTSVLIDGNTVSDFVYGGGNLGMTIGSSSVITKDATINNSIYGGGNAAKIGGNTYVYVSGSSIGNSVYAGGNGTLAIVCGNTSLDIDNNANIGGHVFGGGNAASTGEDNGKKSYGNVNIVGGNILGNVYGGANTSVLYGEATVNVGINVSTNDKLIPSDIDISGTVFGGGEANASGSEVYDYSFISVTDGIKINIDGSLYSNFNIGGSIFGSGNASSTSGYSYINISNYGSKSDIKKNISIQRSDIVTIDNSYIELSGATDRTNEYSNVLFTFSRIDELKLINSSSLYLRTGANLLKKLSSRAISDGVESAGNVLIDNDNSTFSSNVDNRIYMYEGKNLNIATNESATTYGEVSGMTFFGMYSVTRSGNIVTALYDSYDYGDSISSGDVFYFTKGSYVLGSHLTNHDITKDGFYSNYGDDDSTHVIMKYIEPTPSDTNFYMWNIGEKVDSYEVNLTASKYSTLGTYELSLINHVSPNTTFSILGVSYNDLKEGISLIPYKDIPRVNSDNDKANNVFGLNMKSGLNGWITKGNTSFVTEGNSNVTGTLDYERENTSTAAGFVFYFYHSKNLTVSGDLGSVTISMAAITPIDDLNSEVKRININVNLSTALYNTNDYEGTITPGYEYEMFANSKVDITTKSSFSAYYSLFLDSDSSPYKDGYHRSLVSTYLLPVNTKITMIDFHKEDKPVYYYYVVDSDDYNDSLNEYNLYGEVSYDLSKFVRMGSTSVDNNYDDASSNDIYYQNGMAIEEFIFMVDFKDANILEDVLDKSLLLEMRNGDNQTLISVLGIEQENMKYNLYSNKDANIVLDGSLSDNTIYLGKSTTFNFNTKFTQSTVNNNIVYDTRYDDEKMGIMLSIYDNLGNLLNSSSLMGVNFTYNGNTYYPRYNGTTRINIAERLGNIRSKIVINTENSNLSTGEYTLVIESFGSPDGIYYNNTTDKMEVKFNIIDTIYGLKITNTDKFMFIDKDSGKNLNDTNAYVFTMNYSSGLNNPNVRIKLYRRDYSSVYSNEYNLVNLLDYVSDNFNSSSNEYEYYLTDNPINNLSLSMHFKDNLLSGTYRLGFNLYDNNQYIGEVYKYFIIR